MIAWVLIGSLAVVQPETTAEERATYRLDVIASPNIAEQEDAIATSDADVLVLLIEDSEANVESLESTRDKLATREPAGYAVASGVWSRKSLLRFEAVFGATPAGHTLALAKGRDALLVVHDDGGFLEPRPGREGARLQVERRRLRDARWTIVVGGTCALATDPRAALVMLYDDPIDFRLCPEIEAEQRIGQTTLFPLAASGTTSLRIGDDGVRLFEPEAAAGDG